MSDAVIVGIISVIGSVIGNVLLFAGKTRETNASMAAHEQRQQDALDDVKAELGEVKKRLDQHNGYAEKFANASKDIAVMQRDIENVRDQLKNIQLCKTK